MKSAASVGIADGAARLGTDPAAAGRIAENARGYIDLLRAHIGKENNVLFPMADRALDFLSAKWSEYSQPAIRVTLCQAQYAPLDLAQPTTTIAAWECRPADTSTSAG